MTWRRRYRRDPDPLVVTLICALAAAAGVVLWAAMVQP